MQGVRVPKDMDLLVFTVSVALIKIMFTYIRRGVPAACDDSCIVQFSLDLAANEFCFVSYVCRYFPPCLKAVIRVYFANEVGRIRPRCMHSLFAKPQLVMCLYSCHACRVAAPIEGPETFLSLFLRRLWSFRPASPRTLPSAGSCLLQPRRQELCIDSFGNSPGGVTRALVQLRLQSLHFSSKQSCQASSAARDKILVRLEQVCHGWPRA